MLLFSASSAIRGIPPARGGVRSLLRSHTIPLRSPHSGRFSHSRSIEPVSLYRTAVLTELTFPSDRLDQHVCRNSKFVMQTPNHIQRQRPISSHDLVHASSLADHTD